MQNLINPLLRWTFLRWLDIPNRVLQMLDGALGCNVSSRLYFKALFLLADVVHL